MAWSSAESNVMKEFCNTAIPVVWLPIFFTVRWVLQLKETLKCPQENFISHLQPDLEMQSNMFSA